MLWLHRLLNPHCDHCDGLAAQAKHCKSCDILSMENARLVRENERLLDLLLAKPEIPKPIDTDLNEMKPLVPRSIPWNERRRLLEQEERNKAQLLKQNDSNIAKLEEEIINAPRSN